MLFNVEQNELIEKTAEELKKLIDKPSWASFVKTGVHKQRPPVNDDWWYIRAASVLRKIYLLGPIGVSKLKAKYGGKKNRGVQPEKFFEGSGSIARKILQQLEAAKLIKQDVRGKHKGRVITPKGKSILYSVAKSLGGKVTPAKKVAPKQPAPKAEEKKEATPVIPKEEQLMKAPPAKDKAKEVKVEKVKQKSKDLNSLGAQNSENFEQSEISELGTEEISKKKEKAPKQPVKEEKTETKVIETKVTEVQPDKEQKEEIKVEETPEKKEDKQ